MFKIILSFLLSAFLFYPFYNSGELTVCTGGKSQGEFNVVSKKEVDKIIGFDGLSFSLSESELESLISRYRASMICSDTVDGVECFYYYSPSISKIEVVRGKKVNVHVVKANGKITVGIPFIYYGY
ncbi:MAG: hypothetical protein IJA97_02670 [Clostridia bacterium]|nr:hypothetical protein [Clostridia bacterium]